MQFQRATNGLTRTVAEMPTRPAPTQQGFPVTATVKTFDCDLGDFFETGLGMSKLKVTVLDIRKASLPNDYDLPDDYAELDIRVGGSVVFGGPKTIQTGVNRYLLATIENPHQDDEMCVYSLSFTDTHVHLLALRVEHINAHAKRVRISYCDVYGLAPRSS